MFETPDGSLVLVALELFRNPTGTGLLLVVLIVGRRMITSAIPLVLNLDHRLFGLLRVLLVLSLDSGVLMVVAPRGFAYIVLTLGTVRFLLWPFVVAFCGPCSEGLSIGVQLFEESVDVRLFADVFSRRLEITAPVSVACQKNTFLAQKRAFGQLGISRVGMGLHAMCVPFDQGPFEIEAQLLEEQTEASGYSSSAHLPRLRTTDARRQGCAGLSDLW